MEARIYELTEAKLDNLADLQHTVETACSILGVTEALFHQLWGAAHDAKEERVSMTIDEAESVAFTLGDVRERLEEAITHSALTG